MTKFHAVLFGAVSAFGLSSAAYAQTAALTDAQAGSLEEVVITARRPLAESVAAALQVQRNSDSLVSVLSSDAVGVLPDQNIAFAVGRLPGVGVQRDQGQARYINLRGAPVYWTTLSFDGLSVVSPQGRDSRFDNIPSAIASQITVQKAVTPDMQGASVAGNVDIRTRRAFDYPGQTITGKFGWGRVKLGGGDEMDANLVYSNIFADGKLGMVLQGSYYKREMATDNWETDPYLSNTVDPSKRFAREHENKHYRLTRYNFSGSARIDYKPNDNHDLFVSSIYTHFHDDELRDNFIFRLDQGTGPNGPNTTDSALDETYASRRYISGNNPQLGTSYGARINARIDYRDTQEWMSTNTLGGEHHFGGGWDVNWRLNYTYTQDGRDTPVTAAFQSPSAFGLRPTVEYDLRNPAVNTVKLFATGGTTNARVRGAQVSNIEDFQFPLQTIGDLWGGDITMAPTAKLDVTKATELFGASTKIKFGGLYTDRTKKSREITHTWTAPSTNTPTWATFVNGNTLGYLGTQNLNYTFRYTDQDFTTNYVKNLVANGSAPANLSLANYYKVNEKLAAAYLMGITDLSWGNVVYGVRMEHIENTGQAFVAFSTGNQLVSAGSDSTLFFPSLHVNWNVTDNVKARFSATTSASRPDFDDLRPNFTFNDSNQTISGGNPTAKPERQIGLDAYVEWYMKGGGFFSAGVFYKDIKDVLVSRTSVFGLDVLNSGNVNRSGYTLTSPGNGGNGHLKGVEFAYVQTAQGLVDKMGWADFLGGFGVNASATFTSSEVNLPAVGAQPARKISVLGTSDAVYNLQATYEKYGLSVRLAYQYRTPWGESVGAYQTVGGGVYPVDNGDIFWDSDEEMDLSVRYQINKNFEVYFDGSNLTNQGARRYGHDGAHPIEYEKFGQRYVGGVRFKF